MRGSVGGIGKGVRIFLAGPAEGLVVYKRSVAMIRWARNPRPFTRRLNDVFRRRIRNLASPLFPRVLLPHWEPSPLLAPYAARDNDVLGPFANRGFGERGLIRRLLWLVPLIALLALVGWRVVQKKATLAGSGGAAGGKGGRGGGGGGRIAVETAVAGPRSMVVSVQAVGTAASPQTIRLSPPTSGRIIDINVREGDRVTAGQILGHVDPSQLQGTVLQNQAAVAEAQARLAQAQATIGAQDVSLQGAIRTGKASVSGSEASLNQARRTQQALIAAAQATVNQQAQAARAAEASVASAQAQEEAAQVAYRADEVKLQRTQKLFEGGYIAAQDVDDARAAAATALGQVRVAQQAAAAARAQVAEANAQKAAAQAQVVVQQRETQGGILTAQAALRTAQANLTTAQANTSQSAANQLNLTALRSTVQAAQGQLDAAKAELANTSLVSPIDGTVTLRSADPGSLAQPGTPVLTIELLREIYVETSFPVELASGIRPGMEADVTFDNLPGQKFVGSVFDVNRAADPTSRQFTLRVKLENPGLTIRPGMFGEVAIVTSHTNPAVVVPLLALTQTADGKSTVSVMAKDGTVQTREVTVGQRDEQGAQILSGVQAGETVVTERSRAIKDGAKVTVVDPNAKPTAGGRRRKK